MNQEFLRLFMEKTDFPAEARAFLTGASAQLAKAGQEEAMAGTIRFYYENDFDTALTQPLIEDMAQESGLSPYTVWELFLIFAAESARKDYLGQNISEEIFWATFADMRYKVLECKRVKGVWGNFVAFWYPIFFRCDIVKLGRLEYETTVYKGPERTVGGVALRTGDRVRSIHIPSSGEDFGKEARLASYRMAYEFFKDQLGGGPLVCVCHSWLLYPEYKNVLPETSNIVSFMGDFHIVEVDQGDFDDAWRVFGADADKAPADLPEDTSMRRAFKKHLMAGGKTGAALGVLVFDGEKLA